MIISKEYLKNTSLIAIAFILQKSFNLLVPYFLDETNYNEFNKIFYYASFVSTIGTFGFTYAITQLNFTPILLSFLVILNIIISLFFVNIFTGINLSLFNIFNVFVISFVSIIFSIYNFLLLFYSRTDKYFITIIIISLSGFASLILSYLFSSHLLPLYALTNFVGLIFCVKHFERGTLSDIYHVKKFYKLGATTFIINSAAGIVLMADKFFANNFFNIDVANSYTFTWGLVAPIFYLGNIAEKNIYAADNKKTVKSSLFNSFGLIAFGLIVYTIIVYVAANFYPSLLPKSINIELFSKIFLYMMIGNSLFIFFHFPINGILFKLNFLESQKYTSHAYIFIILFFAALYYSKVINIENNDYLSLIFYVVSALLILSVSKFLLLIYLHKSAIFGLFNKSS